MAVEKERNMWVHFGTKADAISKLISDGWKHIVETGFWVSKDGICRASIHPARDGIKVVVLYEEIPSV